MHTHSRAACSRRTEPHPSTHLGCSGPTGEQAPRACCTTYVLCSLRNIAVTDFLPDVQLYAESDQSGTKIHYKPIVFPNDFWLLRSQFAEINSTTPQLPLQVTFQSMTYWKFQIFASMTQGFDDAAKQGGSASGAELDEIKRMLVETNPWFLGLTALVSVLHMVYVSSVIVSSGLCAHGYARFEMLAFSSDVSHWRQKQELVGVSVRSVIISWCGITSALMHYYYWNRSVSIQSLCLVAIQHAETSATKIVTNVVVQIIILLYLIDNNEQTSWMILMGSGVGVLIEAWKVVFCSSWHRIPA